LSGAFCCANKNLSRLIYSPEKAGEKVARQRWEEWANDENRLAVLQAWARAGLSDERIAKHIGISRSTLNEWKKKHQSIRDALKTGKEIANRQVENALFRLTQGGTVKVRKLFKLKKTQYDNNGKKMSEEEYLETGEEDVYIEPDFKAISFWLRNKMPEEWRDKILDNPNDEGPQENLIILTPRQVNQMKEEINAGQNEKN
jgi:transcriptional regulator with XRE-family HTH domain